MYGLGMRTLWGVGLLLVTGCSLDVKELEKTPFDRLDTIQCGYYLAVGGDEVTPAAESEEEPCYRLKVLNDSWITLTESNACDAEADGDRCVVVPAETRIYHWVPVDEGFDTSWLQIEGVACSEGC